MSVDTTTKRPLTQLNRQIEELEAEAARLESERKAVAKDASRAARQVRWLRLAKALRKPTASIELWPIIALVVGAGIIAVLMLIIVNLITGTLGIAFLGLLLGAAGGAYLFYSLLYQPPDAVLPAAIAEAESN